MFVGRLAELHHDYALINIPKRPTGSQLIFNVTVERGALSAVANLELEIK